MRFIVAMRNPVERLWSDFVYFTTIANSERVTPYLFHEQVLKQLQWWQRCVAMHSRRTCLYGTHVADMAELRVHHTDCWIERYDFTVCAAFRLGLYVFFIEDWLESVPRDAFLFLTTERYSEDVADVINTQVLHFLGLQPFSGAEEERMRNKRREYPLKRNAKSRLEKFHFTMTSMLNETRHLLMDFYRPSNKRLAQLLNNDDFLWYDK